LGFLLDTNVVIDARDGVRSVLRKMIEHDGAVLVSALSIAELQRGLSPADADASVRRVRLERLLAHLPVVAFGKAEAEAYGTILSALNWVRGRDFDRLIAGHALSLSATLVTNNARDFRDIPGIRVENWLDAA
jgi:tRNA(fMet)-specific endonuclease VapC